MKLAAAGSEDNLEESVQMFGWGPDANSSVVNLPAAILVPTDGISFWIK